MKTLKWLLEGVTIGALTLVFGHLFDLTAELVSWIARLLS